MPVLVKDQVETAGIATTFGSVAIEGYVPSTDATVIARLKQAGVIVLAKTALPDCPARRPGSPSPRSQG